MRDFFVYGLVHVEERRTFYVGRSHGNENKRLQQHQSKARRGSSEYVYREWRRIEASGGTVTLEVKCGGLTEGESIRSERFTILSIGLDNLTNVGLNTGSAKKRQVSVINRCDGSLAGNFNSISELCERLDISQPTVNQALKGKRHWRYEFIASQPAGD